MQFKQINLVPRERRPSRSFEINIKSLRSKIKHEAAHKKHMLKHSLDDSFISKAILISTRRLVSKKNLYCDTVYKVKQTNCIYYCSCDC